MRQHLQRKKGWTGQAAPSDFLRRLSMTNPFTSDARHSDLKRHDALNIGLLRHPYIQGVINLIYALPHTNQSLRRRAWLENLLAASFALIVVLILCHTAMRGHHSWQKAGLLILISWGHTLYSLRCFCLPNRHACSHGDLTRIPWLNIWIGQTLSVIL
jgi:hypothetical protein